jgi:SAM-dependent methyltransferase
MAFRGRSTAWAKNSEAVTIAKRLLADAAAVSQMSPLQRLFVILPLQNSENLEDQTQSSALIDDLATQSVGTPLENYFARCATLAHSHHDAVLRFGRLPDRNGTLGRTSTEAELKYLEVEQSGAAWWGMPSTAKPAVMQTNMDIADWADDHYEEAHELRRNASTMQCSAVSFLRENGKDIVAPLLSRTTQKHLKVLSIGCGCGELDFSLLSGYIRDERVASVDMICIEPHDKERQKLQERFSKWQLDGQCSGHEKLRCEVQSHSFQPQEINSVASFDMAFLGHVLYHFHDRKQEMLRAALSHVKPGGIVVIVHGADQGVPEIQHELLPILRGAPREVFKASDIDKLLQNDLAKDVDNFVRYDIDAHLDLHEIALATTEGNKIMSFCIEVDLQRCAKKEIEQVRNAFLSRGVERPTQAHLRRGPFMQEPVHCYRIQKKRAHAS